jgi:hypothetical protein
VIQTATIVLPAGRLTASAVDVAGRTIEGIVVPFGEVGQPAIDGQGRRVSVRRGGLTLAAQVTGLDTHDRPKREVSRLDRYEVRAEGIWGRLAVDATPAGDSLLAQVADGRRLGLSVEASGLLLDPATDEIVGGVIDAVAHVDDPAFPSARVHSMAAALAPVPSPEGEHVTEPAPTTVVNHAPPVIDYAALAAALAPQLSAAVAPAGAPTDGLALAPASPGLAPSAGPAPETENPIVRAATLQAEVFRTSGGTPELRAALADITNTGLDLFQNPSTLGEKLWEGAADTTRPFVAMMDTSLALTSWKGTGWQWKKKPYVAAYTGDKAQIPTDTVEVESIEWEADRVAGGWDIDRKFRDFGDAEFWTEFYQAQVDSYREVTNEQAATAIISYALDITVDANVPATFTGINVAQADVLRAAALGSAILRRTPRVNSAPDYVLMNTADWLGLLDITNLDLPAFLALLQVQPGMFDHHPQVPAGQVILGVKKASRFRELGGGTPIRVEALDVARAGIDSAVYGYTARYQTRPGGIIRVPLTTGA